LILDHWARLLDLDISTHCGHCRQPNDGIENSTNPTEAL
jgi:hypothetical protein